MSRKRLQMRKIREILQLAWERKYSQRAIAQVLGLCRATVMDYLVRAEAVKIDWSVAQFWDDSQLESALFPPKRRASRTSDQLDFLAIDQERRKKGVTLALLWAEYKEAKPNGLCYSQYCNLYRAWLKKRDLVMRQEHRAGEKMFVDYAGMSVLIGEEKKPAQIFIAVLGASCYTFAEATWSQNSEDFLGSHTRAFAFFGGVPQYVVPDNLKSAVQKACPYEPVINEAYRHLASHYQTCIMPARVRKPKDKAKAENGVLLVERWILAVLRNEQFPTLECLNKRIGQLLEKLNQRPFRRLPGCRRTRYEAIDKPELMPLPTTPFQLKRFAVKRVGQDYHVAFEGHHYSVPSHLVGLEVDMCYTADQVQFFFRGSCVATHLRKNTEGNSTMRAHMPAKHREYADWTPEKAQAWACSVGESTQRLVGLLLDKPQIMVSMKSVAGLTRLESKYSRSRLESACMRALKLNSISYTSINAILKGKLDLQPLQDPDPTEANIANPNTRGENYYGGTK